MLAASHIVTLKTNVDRWVSLVKYFEPVSPKGLDFSIDTDYIWRILMTANDQIVV